MLKLSDPIVQQLRTRLNRPLLLIGIAVTTFYLPFITQTFAWTDDFVFLNFIRCGNDDYFRFLDVVGRPLQTPLLYYGFWFSQETALGSNIGLIILRVVSLLGIVICAVQFFKLAIELGWQKPIALALTLWLFVTPSWLILAAWATTFVVPWAFIPALFAGQHALKSTINSKVFSILALIISLALYQPAAMAFWLAPCLFISAPNSPPIKPAKFIQVVFLFGLGLAIYYLGHRYFSAPLLNDPLLNLLSQRGNFITADLVFSKLTWFIFYPLPVSMNFIGVIPNFTIAILIFLFAFYKIKQDKYYSITPFIFGGLYLPVLVIAENPEALRLLTAPTMGWLIIAVGGLTQLLRQYHLTHCFISLIILGLTLITALVNGARLQTTLIWPAQSDYQTVSERLIFPPPSEIILQLPDFRNQIPNASPYIEYGMRTLTVPYAAPYLIRQIYADQNFHSCSMTICTIQCDDDWRKVDLTIY